MNAQSSLIDPADKADIKKWADKLGLLPYEAKAVIREAGPLATDVETFAIKMKNLISNKKI